MKGHAVKCGERICELAHESVNQLSKVSTSCLDDHQHTKDDFEMVGGLGRCSCTQTVSTAPIPRTHPETRFFRWTVSALARAVTKWNGACGKTLARLTGYPKCTSDYQQFVMSERESMNANLVYSKTPRFLDS